MEDYVNLHVCQSGGQPIRTIHWETFKLCYSHGDFLPAIEMYLAEYVDDPGMISLVISKLISTVFCISDSLNYCIQY
jgi:hypothetical protein